MDETGADIFLFQEGRPTPDMLNSKDRLVWQAIESRGDWGSGIYSENYEIAEETIETQFMGVFTIGNITINRKSITLISIYGLMEKHGPTKGYSIPNLHRMLSDLTGLLDSKINGKRNIIMAGDLNASVQLDKQQQNDSHKILFDRIADFKLNDVYKLSGNKNYVQTLRHDKSQTLWQNDYFFISDSLAKNFIGYEVIDNSQIRYYSDHNPVVIEINL